MQESQMEIDGTKPEYEISGDDIIKITIGENNENVIEINFSRIYIQSRYIRNKYGYQEAMKIFQSELIDIIRKRNINEQSIKSFFEMIEHQKIRISFDFYNDLYKLCEYFDIPKYITELDKISQHELFRNVNFAIQQLLEFQQTDKSITTSLTSKIEKFLSEKINECIENSKFEQLSVSSIYRIIEQSSSENLDVNKLVDFILKSIENRFVMLKFVEFHKLNEKMIEILLQFFSEQEESSRKTYLMYIPFDYLYVRKMKNENDRLRKELEQTKQKLELAEANISSFENETQILSQKEKKLKETVIEPLKKENEKLNASVADLEKQLNSMKESKQEPKCIDCSFKGNQLSGIFSYLINTFGSDIISKGILDISSGNGETQIYELSNLIKYSTKDIEKSYYNYFGDRDKISIENAWIQFDFIARKIILQSYTIRTYLNPSPKYFPKSWKIVGSNDKSTWDEIDHKVNESSLNGSTKQMNFSCKKSDKSYRYIRFIQEDTWTNCYRSNAAYFIILSCIELFGLLFDFN